jgi:hypothetical protein
MIAFHYSILSVKIEPPLPLAADPPTFTSAGGPRIFFISLPVLATGSGFSSCEERGKPGNSGHPQPLIPLPLKGVQTLKHANPPVYAFTRNLTR